MKRVTSGAADAYYNAASLPFMRSTNKMLSPIGPPGRRTARGFTMVEILVTIAIIGIIAIFVIPNFLDSLNKAKQKRTMADIHETGTAMVSWIAGQMGAAAAGAQSIALSSYGDGIAAEDLEALLVPHYIAHLPRHDAWGHDFEYFLKTESLLAGRVMLIRSAGFDGVFSDDTYEFAPFVTTDFDQDIVWADGIFVRWPVGVTASR